MSKFLPPTGLSFVAREAGYAAFGACLKAEQVKRRTHRLGLPRQAYSTEYGRAAAEAVWQYLAGIDAQRIEAGTDETLQAAQPEGREPGPEGMRHE